MEAYRSTHVGDVYDTSPYPADNPPEIEPYVKREKPQFIVTADWRPVLLTDRVDLRALLAPKTEQLELFAA